MIGDRPNHGPTPMVRAASATATPLAKDAVGQHLGRGGLAETGEHACSNDV
jgi:hypothetical protein